MDKGIPPFLLDYLQTVEPDATFTGILPKLHSSSSGRLYFVKAGSPNEIEQYTGEVESLKAIERAAPGLAPRVLLFVEDRIKGPVFVSEYKVLNRLCGANANVLARRLATELHACGSTNGFGFHVPTFCGVTKLQNGWYESWEQCFRAMIRDLVRQLRSTEIYEPLCRKAETVISQVIPNLLGMELLGQNIRRLGLIPSMLSEGSLKIEPVLLHGDLWSGNVGVDKLENQPIIFDPSSFYGHNEADLAIAKMFGGFPESFFETYHTLRPKSEPVDEYPLRGDLYQLFHYLNHTVLFGGAYAQSADKIMNRLLKM